MTQRRELEKEFFDKLAEKLEDFFPKGECKERGKALMLNAYANLIFRDLLEKYEKTKSKTKTQK